MDLFKRQPLIGPQTRFQQKLGQKRLKNQASTGQGNTKGAAFVDSITGKNNPHGYKLTPAEKMAGTAALVKNMYNKQNKIEDRTSTFLNGKKK